jgi:hypothetical protein
LKAEIYFTDLKEKIIKKKIMFTHSKDVVIKREKNVRPQVMFGCDMKRLLNTLPTKY